MKALTIHQPFAELIARGEKRVENRTWYTRYRGPLAIHAGLTKSGLARAAGEWDREPLPFGAIVAVAEVLDCVPFDPVILNQHHAHHWVLTHPHASGPYCLVLALTQRLAKPIPCRGAQSLWTVPDAIARRLA